ncbi:GNAT family N-acetyltransferase [Streptosporangium sp. NPDC048047]|uniref:GNAT family N-acetyltransferase n=1 Tax=Streptosporangium sp. NPDC048047 TaxID=3155748 RepID=UPI00343945EF
MITTARVEDVPALVASAAALFREDGGRRDPFMDVDWPARDGDDYYRGMVTGEGNLALLARSGSPEGPVVGHLTARMRGRDELRPDAVVAELLSMRVDEEHRGRGVGARLVERFLAWAGERGANQAVVSAYATNSDAVRFYRARGFTPVHVSLQADLGT